MRSDNVTIVFSINDNPITTSRAVLTHVGLSRTILGGTDNIIRLD
jgi:hypothetical protein